MIVPEDEFWIGNFSSFSKLFNNIQSKFPPFAEEEEAEYCCAIFSKLAPFFRASKIFVAKFKVSSMFLLELGSKIISLNLTWVEPLSFFNLSSSLWARISISKNCFLNLFLNMFDQRISDKYFS